MAYSMDLRQRVVAAVEAGESMWSVARRFSVAHPTVRDWRDRARRGRLAADKPGPRGAVKLTEADGKRMFREIETMKRSFRRLEKLGKPVVALAVWTGLRRFRRRIEREEH